MTFWKTTFIWFGIREALRAPKYYQCKDFVQFQGSHWIQLGNHVDVHFALDVEGSAWWDSDVEGPAGLGAMGPPPPHPPPIRLRARFPDVLVRLALRSSRKAWSE